MSPRRRAALLLGLALVLGGLAASDVARRESALRAELAPLVDVVVARTNLAAGHRLAARDLARRPVPARFAPAGAAGTPPSCSPAGGSRSPSSPAARSGRCCSSPRLRRRARASAAADAPRRSSRRPRRTPSPRARAWTSSSRATAARARRGTELALQDVEVLAARAVPAADDARRTGARTVAATLRVTVRQAVYLAAAGAFAREIRLLARAPGDRARVGAMSAVG